MKKKIITKVISSFRKKCKKLKKKKLEKGTTTNTLSNVHYFSPPPLNPTTPQLHSKVQKWARRRGNAINA